MSLGKTTRLSQGYQLLNSSVYNCFFHNTGLVPHVAEVVKATESINILELADLCDLLDLASR